MPVFQILNKYSLKCGHLILSCIMSCARVPPLDPLLVYVMHPPHLHRCTCCISKPMKTFPTFRCFSPLFGWPASMQDSTSHKAWKEWQVLEILSCFPTPFTCLSLLFAKSVNTQVGKYGKNCKSIQCFPAFQRLSLALSHFQTCFAAFTYTANMQTYARKATTKAYR